MTAVLLRALASSNSAANVRIQPLVDVDTVVVARPHATWKLRCDSHSTVARVIKTTNERTTSPGETPPGGR